MTELDPHSIAGDLRQVFRRMLQQDIAWTIANDFPEQQDIDAAASIVDRMSDAEVVHAVRTWDA